MQLLFISCPTKTHAPQAINEDLDAAQHRTKATASQHSRTRYENSNHITSRGLPIFIRHKPLQSPFATASGPTVVITLRVTTILAASAELHERNSTGVGIGTTPKRLIDVIFVDWNALRMEACDDGTAVVTWERVSLS